MADDIDWETAEDVTAKALPSLIERADKGDVNAKRRLLEIFNAQVDANQTPYSDLLQYLARCFESALESPTAAKTLGQSLLGSPAHRPPSPKTKSRNEAIVLEVALLRAKNISRDAAVEQVAGNYSLNTETVLEIYKAGQHDIKHLAEVLFAVGEGSSE